MKSVLEEFKQNLLKAGIIDTNTKSGGSFIWLPDGIVIRNLFVNSVRDLCSKNSIDEFLFPTIMLGEDFSNITNDIFDFSKRVFWLDENKLLRPSGEGIFYPQFARWIKTYKDLPIRAFQIGTAFRKGTPRGIFRANEADLFIEGHTAHSSREEAEEQVEIDIKIIKDLLDFMGLPVIFTDRPLWGNNPVGERIVGFDTLLPTGETLLVGSAYSQMQIFSKPFNIQFRDINNKKDFTYQTSFGFSSRMIFASLLLSSNKKGLNILPQIAPKQIVIMPISKRSNKQSIMEYTNKIYNNLTREGYRVEIDNSEKHIGDRRYLNEMKGTPIRIEIGDNEMKANIVTVISRETNEHVKTPINLLQKQVKSMLEETTIKIKQRIQKKHSANIIKYKSITDDINQAIGDGKVATFPLCYNKKCCKHIEQKIRGEVIGYSETTTDQQCIVCGNITKNIAFQARHI